jgi:Domain of unknown function (DUF4328)
MSALGLFASVALAIGVGLQLAEIGAWLALDSETYESTERVLMRVGVLARVAGTIAFLVWIYRTIAKLHSFGVQGLTYKPGAAVGLWFVPFLNLVHGYRVVVEAWKASDPDTIGAAPYAWVLGNRNEGSGIILHWWLAYIASRIVTSATRVASSVPICVIAAGVEIVALVLLVIVVRRIDQRQSAYAERLQQEAPQG